MECPLCFSRRVEPLESITGRNLRKLYTSLVDLGGLSSDLWQDCRYVLCNECDLHFFYPAICGDENFYGFLQQYEWYYLDEKNEFEMAARHLKPGMQVLDVGAGRGAFRQHATGCEYTGLEFSEKAQKYAKSQGVIIERKSIEDLAMERSQSMDVVCSFQVLEHVSRPASFLSACVDVLKPGGKLIISVPALDGFTGISPNSPLNLPPHHVTRWSNRSLEVVAQLYGLRLLSLENEPVQPIHSKSAANAKLMHELRKVLGRPSACVDLSVIGKIIAQLAQLAVRWGLYSDVSIGGHTVIAVYQK